VLSGARKEGKEFDAVFSAVLNLGILAVQKLLKIQSSQNRIELIQSCSGLLMQV